MGQLSTHRPHRMQGPSSTDLASFSLYTTMPLVALVVGMVSLGAQLPVMPPPQMILPGYSLYPPQALMASCCLLYTSRCV